MAQEKYIALIIKKLKGNLSLEEQATLDIWTSQSTENHRMLQEMEEDWQVVADYEASIDVELDVAADFKALQARIALSEQPTTTVQDNLRVAHQPLGKVVSIHKKKRTSRWIGWASAAVIALALGFWFTSNSDLDNSEIIALTTNFQEKQTVELADGTKVTLNENSQLTYSTAFTNQTRKVELVGEAFFEVAKDATKPFIIATNNTKVTVLGTSFNVRAKLAESATEVVVKTGKVRLENVVGDKKVELVANQKGIFNATDNTILRKEELDMNELAWMSDKILFKTTKLKDALADLSTQFEVTIQLKNANLGDCPIDGLHKRSDGVQKILDDIASNLKMEVRTIGNTSFELVGGECVK